MSSGARITHVAIRFHGVTYALPAPNRHHHVIRVIVEKTGKRVTDDEQGFLDEEGRFLTREEALARALALGQVKDVENIRAGLLFSEDLW